MEPVSEAMSSSAERRQQKTPGGAYPQKEAVNPPGAAGGPSSVPAQSATQPNGVGYDLMEGAVGRENMLRALRCVEQNKGAAGVDGMGVKSLRNHLKESWPRLKEELLVGAYKPQPVRRVEIPKPDGGTRPLGIPTVTDRLIQQALLQILTPVFDPEFSEFSYGFRPGRSAHQAVKQARRYIEEGFRFMVDIDLEKFFDRVNHDALMARVARKVRDKRVLKLIRAYLNAGVMAHGVCIKTNEGTPQGGPLSPLLANIMLDDLDKELERRGHRFVRYADDCNIYIRSRRAGERVMESIKELIEKRLKLKINEAKSAVEAPRRRKFLGFSFTGEERPRIRLSAKTVDRFKEKIRQLTKRSRSISLKERITKLNVYLRGWIGYFRLAETPSVFEPLDKWIRRRLRMGLLKQWKKPKTRKKSLVALGIAELWAGCISGSRKGLWRLSNTPQVNKALGLAYCKPKGSSPWNSHTTGFVWFNEPPDAERHVRWCERTGANHSLLLDLSHSGGTLYSAPGRSMTNSMGDILSRSLLRISSGFAIILLKVL
jgi:group II intron reverse transcriptase/maturase